MFISVGDSKIFQLKLDPVWPSLWLQLIPRRSMINRRVISAVHDVVIWRIVQPESRIWTLFLKTCENLNFFTWKCSYNFLRALGLKTLNWWRRCFRLWSILLCCRLQVAPFRMIVLFQTFSAEWSLSSFHPQSHIKVPRGIVWWERTSLNCSQAYTRKKPNIQMHCDDGERW